MKNLVVSLVVVTIMIATASLCLSEKALAQSERATENGKIIETVGGEVKSTKTLRLQEPCAFDRSQQCVSGYLTIQTNPAARQPVVAGTISTKSHEINPLAKATGRQPAPLSKNKEVKSLTLEKIQHTIRLTLSENETLATNEINPDKGDGWWQIATKNIQKGVTFEQQFKALPLLNPDHGSPVFGKPVKMLAVTNNANKAVASQDPTGKNYSVAVGAGTRFFGTLRMTLLGGGEIWHQQALLHNNATSMCPEQALQMRSGSLLPAPVKIAESDCAPVSQPWFGITIFFGLVSAISYAWAKKRGADCKELKEANQTLFDAKKEIYDAKTALTMKLTILTNNMFLPPVQLPYEEMPNLTLPRDLESCEDANLITKMEIHKNGTPDCVLKLREQKLVLEEQVQELQATVKEMNALRTELAKTQSALSSTQSVREELREEPIEARNLQLTALLLEQLRQTISYLEREVWEHEECQKELHVFYKTIDAQEDIDDIIEEKNIFKTCFESTVHDFSIAKEHREEQDRLLREAEDNLLKQRQQAVEQRGCWNKEMNGIISEILAIKTQLGLLPDQPIQPAIAGLLEKNQELHGQVATLTGKNNVLTEGNNKLSDGIISVQESLDQSEKAIDGLQNQVLQLTGESADLIKNLEDKTNEWQQKQLSLEEKNLVDLESSFEDKEVICNLNTQVTELKQELLTAQQATAAATTESKELKAVVASHEKELDTASQLVGIIGYELSVLSREEILPTIQKLLAQNDSLRKIIQERRQDLDQVEGKNLELAEKNQQLEAELSRSALQFANVISIFGKNGNGYQRKTGEHLPLEAEDISSFAQEGTVILMTNPLRATEPVYAFKETRR